MPSRHSTVTPPVVLGHKVKTCHRGSSAMLGKFLKKTVLFRVGHSTLALASLFIVFFATPTVADASIVSTTYGSQAVGDMIVATCYSGEPLIPATPSGWTYTAGSVTSGTGDGYVATYVKVAPDTSTETAGSLNCMYSAFRSTVSGATLSVGASSTTFGNVASNNAFSIPALTILNTADSSIVYGSALGLWGYYNATPTAPSGYTTLTITGSGNSYYTGYNSSGSSVSAQTLTGTGANRGWGAQAVEIMETLPPDPVIVFESPTDSQLIPYDFRSGGDDGLYVSLYRIPNNLSFDTIQIKLPDSYTSSTRWTVAGYYQATSTLPIELCAGTTGNNECNGIVSGGGVSFQTSGTCTVVATGVCEMSLGSERDMAGVLTYLYLAVDPNTPYQNFSSHGVYGDVGYSCDGGNGNCVNLAPVIKLCKNGCSDDVFDSTAYNSSYIPYTRVVSVTPSATTTATSTSFVFGGTVNIMPDDYVASSTFRLSVIHQSSVQQVSALQAWETFTEGTYLSSFYIDFPVTGQGTTNYSTTTDISSFPEGKYTITGELIIPDREQSLWQTFQDILITASGNTPAETEFRLKSWFIIGQPTFYDEIVTDVVAQTNLALIDLAVCSPFSGDFDIADCLLLLIIPPTATLQTMGDSLVNNALRVFPLGYITRMLEIITLSTPLTPPALTYTYGTSAPTDIQGMTVSFQIFDGFTLIPTILADDGSGKDVWGIVMPYFNTIIALGVLGVILMDILKLGLPNFGGDGYTTSGDVPVSQLPDQPDRNKVTYGQVMNIKIKNRTRRNNYGN